MNAAHNACVGGCDQYVEIAIGGTSPHPRNYFSKESAALDGVKSFGGHDSWSDCQAFCVSNFSQVRQEQVPCKQACLLGREECGDKLNFALGKTQVDDTPNDNPFTHMRASLDAPEATFQTRVEATACAFTLGFYATKIDDSKNRTCYSFCDWMNVELAGGYWKAFFAEDTNEKQVMRQRQCHCGCDVEGEER
jgi:hypothetical protein